MVAVLSDYATRIWDFAFAFFTQFFLLATGIIFLLDQLLSRNVWPKAFLDRLHELWPEDRRHRTFRRLVISGLAICAFLAFDRVNEDFRRQTAQPRPTENRASISFRMEVAGFVAGLKSRSIIKI